MISKYFLALKYSNLANIVTTLVIVFDFLSAILITRGELMWSFTCFFLAIGGDTIDGVIARKLKQSSPFGIQLDSLADAISFSFLPAFLNYYLVMAVYSVCCVAVFFSQQGCGVLFGKKRKSTLARDGDKRATVSLNDHHRTVCSFGNLVADTT